MTERQNTVKDSANTTSSEFKAVLDIDLNEPPALEDDDNDIENVIPNMVVASKVPMFKPGEFELWRMRIEQYIQMIDYALWEVIESGATLPKTQVVEGVTTLLPLLKIRLRED
ncbi:hypothetical protein Tco_1075119 [Tanacetum coccineum]